DGDVDLEITYELRDVAVAQRAGIDEAVERSSEARMHRARRMGREGDCGRLETGAVMALEQPGRQQRHRMVAEIGGQIGDADARMWVMLAAPERPGRCGVSVLHEAPCAAELEPRVGGAGQKMEGQRRGLPAGYCRFELGARAREIRPVAGKHLGIQMHAL